jgi:restriction endonuclease S subunit
MMKKIPEGWKKVRLGEVVEIIGDGTPKTSVAEYWNGDIPWITPKDLSNYIYWRWKCSIQHKYNRNYEFHHTDT